MGGSEGCASVLLVHQGRPDTQDKCSRIPLIVHPILTLFQIIDVVNKTLAFHTSVNYQIKAPQPFTNDVHEDLLADLARIQQQKYSSDYDLHIDLSRTLKRLNDGHCVWINRCFVSHNLPCCISLLTSHSTPFQDCMFILFLTRPPVS